MQLHSTVHCEKGKKVNTDYNSPRKTDYVKDIFIRETEKTVNKIQINLKTWSSPLQNREISDSKSNMTFIATVRSFVETKYWLNINKMSCAVHSSLWWSAHILSYNGTCYRAAKVRTGFSQYIIALLQNISIMVYFFEEKVWDIII